MKNAIIKLLVIYGFIFILFAGYIYNNSPSIYIQNGCNSVSKSNPIDKANRNLSPFTDSNGKNINITVEFRPISEDFKPVPEIGYRRSFINKVGKLVSPFHSESEVVYEVNK